MTNPVSAQRFVKMDTIEAPNELNEIVSGRIKRTFQVDFDGNGTDDYICQLDFQNKTKQVFKEVWINSDFEKVKTKEKYLMDYDYFWFVNIDKDPEPEILSATGYPDGIDYCFIDQDIKKGKDKVLFYFNPVILSKDSKYWGYPWDISDLIVQKNQGEIRLRCSLNHNITRDGEITRPDWQNMFPVICFSGQSSQPNISVGEINSLNWLTTIDIIDEIIVADKRKY